MRVIIKKKFYSWRYMQWFQPTPSLSSYNMFLVFFPGSIDAAGSVTLSFRAFSELFVFLLFPP